MYCGVFFEKCLDERCVFDLVFLIEFVWDVGVRC